MAGILKAIGEDLNEIGEMIRGTGDRAQEKAEDIQRKVDEANRDAREGAGEPAGVRDHRTLGERVQDTLESGAETASNTFDQGADTVSNTLEAVSNTVDQGKEAVSNTVDQAKGKSRELRDTVSDNMREAREAAEQRVSDALKTVAGTGADTASEMSPDALPRDEAREHMAQPAEQLHSLSLHDCDPTIAANPIGAIDSNPKEEKDLTEHAASAVGQAAGTVQGALTGAVDTTRAKMDEVQGAFQDSMSKARDATHDKMRDQFPAGPHDTPVEDVPPTDLTTNTADMLNAGVSSA